MSSCRSRDLPDYDIDHCYIPQLEDEFKKSHTGSIPKIKGLQTEIRKGKERDRGG